MNIRQRWINPVLEKEFRLRMRTVRSPLALMFYLTAIGLLALGFMYVITMNVGTGALNPARSRELFYFLSGLQLVLITFMTPGLTAGAISGERERQTLGMLLTTQQSSTAIIMSKLLASISFMLLIVFATLPIYSIVFLYGGISPAELASVFLFYVFVMITLGSFGIFFSTLIGKTVVSVIASYGITLFIYGFTALAAAFVASITHKTFISGVLLSMNPMAALISIFQPGFSQDIWGTSTDLQIWHVFVIFYGVLTLIAIWISIYKLRPVNRRRKKRQASDKDGTDVKQRG